MIRFFAIGEPKGQPRPRAFSRGGHVRVYDPGTAEGWKGAIAAAAREYLPSTPLQGPVRVDIDLYFPRPKGHYGTGKNANRLKDTAPLYHESKPDRDNCDKAILDTLTTLGFFGDDAQVCCGEIWKRYGPASVDVDGRTAPAGAWIRISPMVETIGTFPIAPGPVRMAI